MPGRITPLVNGQYYHIFNRGSDKRDLFIQPQDYRHFQRCFFYYQFLGPKIRFSKLARSDLDLFNPDPNKKMVEIIAFCLMPNHFHFLVRQVADHGISTFMSQLSNSYTKYFNTKYYRVGPLLQGAFKAVLVESEEQLLHLSRYIHLNPIVSSVTKNLNSYQWSSYSEYLDGQGLVCDVGTVLNFFPNPEKYQDFVKDQIGYGTSLEVIKHQTMDLEN